MVLDRYFESAASRLTILLEKIQKPVSGKGSPDSDLEPSDLRSIVFDALASVKAGARVLAIIPDKTRDDNTHLLFPMAASVLAKNGITKLDALVAQGTHSPMTDAEKLAKIGVETYDSISNLGGDLRSSLGPPGRTRDNR